MTHYIRINVTCNMLLYAYINVDMFRVCVYICAYAYINICIYTYMNICIYMCICVHEHFVYPLILIHICGVLCAWACEMWTYPFICVTWLMYTCDMTHLCMYACMNVDAFRVCVCICAYAYIHICIYTCINICAYAYMDIFYIRWFVYISMRFCVRVHVNVCGQELGRIQFFCVTWLI